MGINVAIPIIITIIIIMIIIEAATEVEWKILEQRDGRIA